MDVFTLAEVAAVLQVPKSRVKNWTIGRPLKIIPEIMAARGTGSRNLYSLNDVYMMALINQLSEDGFSSKTIQKLMELEQLHTGALVGIHHFLVLAREKGRLNPNLFYGRFPWDFTAKREKGVLGKYILDLRGLKHQVDDGVAKLRGRN